MNIRITDLIDNTPDQLSKFRTKNWIKINDRSRGVYNINSDIRFKTIMLKSSLCDYSNAYILKEEKQLLEQEMMLQQDDQMKEIKV